MERTLGDLVDALITTNLKLWFVQDQVHKAADAGQGLDADTVQKLKALNLQRNRLMTAIDHHGKTGVDPRVKLA